VALDLRGTISEVVGNASAVRAVNRDLLVVLTESVAVSVGVGEQTALEHLVVGRLNAGNEMRRGEGRLLDFGVVVLRVTVENKLADFL
jgi:hypothetical protein